MFAVYAVTAFLLVIAVGVIVSRRRGARMHYLDAWTPEPGEEQRLVDPEADFYVVPRLGQARVMTFARRHRTTAVVTDRSLVIAAKAALSKRRAITHVVHLAPAQGSVAALGQLSGGLFSIGYVALSASAAGITDERDGQKPYIKIVPDPTPSAVNIDHLRLYCDDAARMRAALVASAAPAGG
jgi:hypothetical protein